MPKRIPLAIGERRRAYRRLVSRLSAQRGTATAEARSAHRKRALALVQLLLQVAEGHQGVTEGHSRSGIAHDLPDALLRLSSLAANVAVLAVSLMPARTRNGTLERALYSGAALRTHAGFVFGCTNMVAAAINATDGLEGSSVFRYVSHAIQYREGRQLIA